MEALEDLLVNAFAKFLAAGLTTDRARLGLFGNWVVNEFAPVPASETQLDRAIASRDAWPNFLADFPNPYSDLVSFYETGASLGRWENGILDVFAPGTEKLWGIPLRSLIDAASHSIYLVCAKMPGRSIP